MRTVCFHNCLRMSVGEIYLLFVPGGKKPANIRKTDLLAFGVLLSQHLQNGLEFSPRIVFRKMPLVPPSSLLQLGQTPFIEQVQSCLCSCWRPEQLEQLNIFILYPGKNPFWTYQTLAVQEYESKTFYCKTKKPFVYLEGKNQKEALPSFRAF